ncbi:MAG: multiheme c-type cytochrome [Sandaracinaceae bacterium]
MAGLDVALPEVMRRTLLVASLVGTAAIALFAARAGATRAVEGLFNRGSAPIEVGRTPRGLGGTDAEACTSCHAEIGEEWTSSMHRAAWTDPVFQSAFREEPLEACRNCHAPLREPGEEPSGVAAHEGVSCSTCHVRDGRVLGVGRTHGAPHPVERVPDMARSEYCAGCHQFDFPSERRTARGHPASGEPMQDSYEEWALSDAAAEGVQCNGCHMPRVRGRDGSMHASHRFLGTRDEDFLRSAVALDARAHREGDEVVVELRVIPRAIGHAFPTGDLFRRGELRAWADDGTEASPIALAREFVDAPERMPDGTLAFVRRQRGDSRVSPPGLGDPPVHTLRLETAADRVHVALDHLLMPTPLAASQGFSQARVRRTLHEVTIVVEEEGTR